MARQSRPLERTSEPGIYKRGNRYVVMYRDAYGKQHKRSGGTTLKQAKDVKGRLRADVADGVDTEVTRETFAAYAARWVEHYGGRTNRGVREETRRDYRRVLEQDAIPFLGHLRLSQVRQKHLNDLAKRVADRGVAPATVRLALAPVKALLADALAAGDLRVNPAAGWRPRYGQAVVEQDEQQVADDVKALTEDQLAALLGEVSAEWRPFYAFLAQTGLRISEAIELRWRDFTFGLSPRVTVSRRLYRGKIAPPKSKYGRRTIRLSRPIADALAQQAAASNDPDALAFTSSTGLRIDQSNLMTRVLKPAAVRAGIGQWIIDGEKKRAETWVGHHTFRHTCATLLFLNGWNAKQVQVWLGHHSPAFTLATYVHLLPDDLPDLPESFGEWAGGNAGVTQPAETHRNATAVEGRNPASNLAAVRAG